MENNQELYHWGIKGMKWGVRRFQNNDGTLTPAGKKRYAKYLYSENTYRSAYHPEVQARKSLGKVKEISEYRKQNKVYNEAMSKADDYRQYKKSFHEKREKVWRDVLDGIEKKYGKYEDLERQNDAKTMSMFDKEYDQELDRQFKKHGVYSEKKILDEKLTVYKQAQTEALDETRKFVNDFIGVYGDQKVKDALTNAIMGDINGSHFPVEHSAIFNATSDELYHWGIKGMKWGRRRYQNKDGSLTPEGRKRYGDDDPNESTEQKRERLLKSTNAQELYKNRNLLTTQEINDRLNRINTEQRLADLAAKDQKSGFDRVDKFLKIGRKINEVYEYTNTPVMKALKKQLGISKAEDNVKKSLGIDEALKKWDQLSDDQIAGALKRANNKKALEKLKKDADDAKKAIQKEVTKEAEKEAENNTQQSNSQNGNSQSNYTKSQPFVKPKPQSEQEKVNDARENRVNNSDDAPISKGILYDRTGNEILNQFTDTRAVDIPTAKVDTGKKYTDEYLRKLRSGY